MRMRVILGIAILGVLVALGGAAPALGAQLDALVDPNSDTSEFKMTYQRTAFIEYPLDSSISEFLYGKEWVLSGTAGSDDPAVQKLIMDLNNKIRSDGSTSMIEDVTVDYNVHMTGRTTNTSFDFKVILEGTLANYVITQDSLRSLVDLGWRGVSTNEPVVIDGVDINIPLNMLQTNEPEIYELVANTEAGDILTIPVLNADFILEQPMTNWHFLFDPTGISADAERYKLSEELAGKVLSRWTMGESSIREGRQIEREWDASVTGHTHSSIAGDISYDIRAVQSADQGSLTIVGFGTLDSLEGVEIVGVTPQAPEGTGTTSTGNFPVFIIYGMAGLAAVGGGLFFVFSNRALKHEKQGQQGIDPSRLVGYQTSASSGGYQTNRGEAQLRDQSEYQQTRSYYDQLDEPQKSSQTSGSTIPAGFIIPEETTPAQPEGFVQLDDTVTAEPEVESTPPEPEVVASCACATSEASGMECDCQMQGSCLCDATCNCSGEVCIEHVSSL